MIPDLQELNAGSDAECDSGIWKDGIIKDYYAVCSSCSAVFFKSTLKDIAAPHNCYPKHCPACGSLMENYATKDN